MAFFALIKEGTSQWLVRTDPLNMLFQNYNAGIERQKGRHITGLDVSYLNKGWVWQSEFPGYAQASGVRVNLDHKIFFRKAPVIYVGSMVRMEKLYFKELTHWRADYYYTRDDKRLILAGKIGIRLGKERLKTDFGIGPAVRFLNRKEELLYINAPGQEQNQEELIEQAIRSLSGQRFSVQMVPMLHLQFSWQLGSK